MKSRYDLHCPIQPEKLCPAKVEIISTASGDETGQTQIDNDFTEAIVYAKFREQDAVARIMDLRGHHGEITDICPVRPTMNENVVRQGVLSLIRGGFRRASNRTQ